MKQPKKMRDGITLYPQPGKKVHSAREGNHSFLLSAVQVLTVCFLAFSWWQSLTSVFFIQTDTQRMYSACFFFAVFLAAVWNVPLHAAIKGLFLAAAAGSGSFWIWRHLDRAVNVLNLTANAYLTVCQPDAVPYPVEPVPARQMAVMFAVYLIPLLLVWSLTLHIRRGRILGIFLLLAPAAFALIVAQVPSEKSCWMLLLSGAVYLSVCGCQEGRAAFAKGISCACIVTLFILLSAFGSRPLEQYKEPADGFYAHTRESIETRWIAPLQDAYAQAKAEYDASRQNQENVEEKPENTEEQDQEKIEEESQENVQGQDQEKTEEENQENVQAQNQENAEEQNQENTGEENQENTEALNQVFGDHAGLETGNPAGGHTNLGALSCFRPDSGRQQTVTLDSRPKETVYYPSLYGEYYSHSRWSKVHSNSELPSTIYLQYPQELERLEKLCREKAPETLADASDFIQSEFEEHTVYDFEPGPTPGGQDFAEYFLFENRKGFCVHFATTAALMYRMCGYPARYVQGYAVPASAFHRQEDGSYAAEVTGEMGHAWCEVFEEGEWILKEHTLPYHGLRPETGIPATSESGRSWTRSAAGWGLLILKACAACAVCLLMLWLLFFLQAAFRRQRKYRRFRTARHGAGIQRVYRAVYEMAVFQGMEDADLLSLSGFERLRDSFPELPLDELEWLYHTVLETMFYEKTVTREDTGRAWKIYQQFSRIIKKKLSVSRKWICSYIKAM